MTSADQSERPVFQTHNGFEVYPMPLFAATETADVNALAGSYQVALGFGVMFKAPDRDGQPIMAHLRGRRYQDVLIRPVRSGSETIEVGGGSLCLQAGEDVNLLAARAAAVPAFGKARVEAAVDTSWNTRHVRIIDPDGRVLVFTQPRFDPELTKRMPQQFEADRAAGT